MVSNEYVEQGITKRSSGLVAVQQLYSITYTCGNTSFFPTSLLH